MGIVANPEDPIKEVGQRFLEWSETAKDVGSTISAALSGFQGEWADAARNTPQARQGKAAGNGSLMRTLPVALAYPGEKAMLRQSARLSSTGGRAVERARKITPESCGPVPLPDGFWKRLEAVESLQYPQLQPSGYAGYAVGCLEAAAWCCLNSTSLEEALVQVVNLAGESDTMAAVAGGIAGAYWGTGAIPERWLIVLHQRAEIEHAAVCLAELRS